MKNSIHHRDIVELCSIHRISESDKKLALGFLQDSYKASYSYIDYCISENKPVTGTFTEKAYKLLTKINNHLKQLKMNNTKGNFQWNEDKTRVCFVPNKYGKWDIFNLKKRLKTIK